jgi:hypothetical protein
METIPFGESHRQGHRKGRDEVNIDKLASPLTVERRAYEQIHNGLTKREYAAIHLRVPDSGDPVIDAMIRRSRRWELASLVHVQGWSDDAEQAIEVANELIAAEGGGK